MLSVDVAINFFQKNFNLVDIEKNLKNNEQIKI